MIYLNKEQILQKIQENQTPYWVLYQLLSNGHRAGSPLDFNDPDNVTGSESEKIAQSVAKLEGVLDFYAENLEPGSSLYFHLVARPSRKSNGETAKFEYNIRLKKDSLPAETNHQNDNSIHYTNPPLGYIPKEILDEKSSLIEERMRIAVKEESLKQREADLARREAELKEKLDEVENDAAVIKKGMKKAIVEVIDGWADVKSGGTLGGEPETPHEKAVEQLAEYIFENTANENEVEILSKYIKKFIIKIQEKNGVSEKTEQ